MKKAISAIVFPMFLTIVFVFLSYSYIDTRGALAIIPFVVYIISIPIILSIEIYIGVIYVKKHRTDKCDKFVPLIFPVVSAFICVALIKCIQSIVAP